jgi:hypothetical protein
MAATYFFTLRRKEMFDKGSNADYVVHIATQKEENDNELHLLPSRQKRGAKPGDGGSHHHAERLDGIP